MVDPVEELFQVDIHDDGGIRTQQALRPFHRLMCRALHQAGCLGERSVPVARSACIAACRIQAVEHRRMPSSRTPPDAFGISTPHRLRPALPPRE
ncbi:hypothetical protein LJR220_003582 [Bradyrhizobium sp. LjRoot220]